MNNINFIAIDFETANEKASSVCSLGIVIVEKGKIVDQKYKLFRPHEMRFNWRNIEVHGINPEDVANEPEFKQYWKSIKEILMGKHVIAHNAAFDIRALKDVLDVYGLEYPEFSYSCTVKLSRRAWPGLNGYKLNLMGERLGLEFRHHHALDDAIMCAEVFLAAAKELNANSENELLELVEISQGKVSPAGCYPDKALKRKKGKS